MLTRLFTNTMGQLETPSYFYDIDLLRQTLHRVRELAQAYNFQIHYAVKANANRQILKQIAGFGLGADCVSGNEMGRVLECGFNPNEIVFAGVGKTDKEIGFALEKNIFCFHCESLQELEVINEMAKNRKLTVRIALRINPDVEAQTHAFVTTGTKENKFGLVLEDAVRAAQLAKGMPNIEIIGLHFHIGSQITDLQVFKRLAERINEIQFGVFGDYPFSYLNVGGGLGIDYENPKANKIPDFQGYFQVFAQTLRLKAGQKVHFELGRSIVGQCGTLLTRVLYIKETANQTFVIVDAGMNDLLRPALYGARHSIENMSASGVQKNYTVVGPVCETSDSFGKNVQLSEVQRGDLLAIYSAGAYGETMGSAYNLRDKTGIIFSNSEILSVCTQPIQ